MKMWTAFPNKTSKSSPLNKIRQNPKAGGGCLWPLHAYFSSVVCFACDVSMSVGNINQINIWTKKKMLLQRAAILLAKKTLNSGQRDFIQSGASKWNALFFCLYRSGFWLREKTKSLTSNSSCPKSNRCSRELFFSSVASFVSWMRNIERHMKTVKTFDWSSIWYIDAGRNGRNNENHSEYSN